MDERSGSSVQAGDETVNMQQIVTLRMNHNLKY